MKIGANLSFAIKRWIDPPELAGFVKGDLGLDYVQFTWDLADPWWPADRRDRIAVAYAKAFRESGAVVESSFGGLASYCFNHFLGPTEDMRALGYEHLKRAIDMTAAMEVPVVGMPLGSYSYADARNPGRREEILKIAEGMLVKLCGHAKQQGLTTLVIEPVPLASEFPSSAGEARRLMADLDGQTDVPVRLLVDWGHALMEPLFGEDANMELWMDHCGPYIHSYHIQQTDGVLDRHWNFTRNGIVTPERLQEHWMRYGHQDETYFMEIVYPFEVPDTAVRQDMLDSVTILRRVPDRS